jgi:hypothetical protein
LTDLSLSTYISKAVLALIVLAAAGYFFLYISKRKGWLHKNSDKLYVISSLPLGRDIFFIVRCGPEVIGIVTGPSGNRVVGRWSLEDWSVSDRNNG